MQEIVFAKSPSDYRTQIVLEDPKPNKDFFLDTGSPITVISIPTLIQITGEVLSGFYMSIDRFLTENSPIEMGGYGIQDSKERFVFVPYIVNEVTIGAAVLKPFMFWVNITNYKSKHIKDSSTLFGMDYIIQGKKWFDENDDFHIEYSNKLRCDTKSVGAALKQRGGIQKLDFVDIDVSRSSCAT